MKNTRTGEELYESLIFGGQETRKIEFISLI